MRPTRLSAKLALPALAALALAGCGLTDAEIEPRVAVSVDGRSISLAEVDEVARDLCEVVQSSDRQQLGVVPGGDVRVAAQQGLALRLVGEELLDYYDLALPDDLDVGEQTVRLTFGDADPEVLDRVLPAFTGAQYFNAVLSELGRDAVGPEAGGEAALVAGIERAQEWQEQADIETNPVLPTFEIGDEDIISLRDDLTVPVSDDARAALSTQEGYAEGLPAAQRCEP